MVVAESANLNAWIILQMTAAAAPGALQYYSRIRIRSVRTELLYVHIRVHTVAVRDGPMVVDILLKF